MSGVKRLEKNVRLENKRKTKEKQQPKNVSQTTFRHCRVHFWTGFLETAAMHLSLLVVPEGDSR